MFNSPFEFVDIIFADTNLTTMSQEGNRICCGKLTGSWPFFSPVIGVLASVWAA